MSQKPSVVVTMTRRCVETGDIDWFLDQLAPENLPKGQELARLMGGMEITLFGYPPDAGEFHEIPEVRKFFQELHAAWPCWFFFGRTETDTLRSIVACLSDNLTTIRRADLQGFQIVLPVRDLQRFIEDCGIPFVELCTRANLGANAQKLRILRLFQYFELL